MVNFAMWMDWFTYCEWSFLRAVQVVLRVAVRVAARELCVKSWDIFLFALAMREHREKREDKIWRDENLT